jgi:hypothetical protein
MSPLHITLGGKDRAILYSVAAIEEIEAATGKTIIQLLGVPNFDVGLSGLVTMLHIGIKHGGEGNLARERIRTMIDRDFDAGRLTIQDLIGTVQKGLVRSSTFRSQVSAEVLAEIAELEKEGEGGRPTESANGDAELTRSSTN